MINNTLNTNELPLTSTFINWPIIFIQFGVKRNEALQFTKEIQTNTNACIICIKGIS